MEENLLPTREPSRLPSRWLATAVFGVVVCLVLAFTWRMFGFYRDIQDGTINPALAFADFDTTSSADILARLAASKEGSFALETEDDPSLGPKDARLTIVEFADFGCPYSEEVSRIVRAAAQQYSEDVRVIFRDFPLTDVHPGADLAARAGECAQEQGAFWEYHDALYAQDNGFTEDALIDSAAILGLDEQEFSTCLNSKYYLEEVADDMADGAAAGVVGTPTFFFNGVKVEGSIPFSTFNEIIHAFLAQ